MLPRRLEFSFSSARNNAFRYHKLSSSSGKQKNVARQQVLEVSSNALETREPPKLIMKHSSTSGNRSPCCDLILGDGFKTNCGTEISQRLLELILSVPQKADHQAHANQPKAKSVLGGVHQHTKKI